MRLVGNSQKKFENPLTNIKKFDNIFIEKRVVTNTRKAIKMTNREFFESVVEGIITEEVVAKAKENLENLDKRNANRKMSKSVLAKREEDERIAEKALKFLENKEIATASEIGKALGISTQKASFIAKILENSERVKVSDVIYNKRIVKGYSL